MGARPKVRRAALISVEFHERAFCGRASVRSSFRLGEPALVVMRVPPTLGNAATRGRWY
jgi:hypothetical protein